MDLDGAALFGGSTGKKLLHVETSVVFAHSKDYAYACQLRPLFATERLPIDQP